MVLLTEVCRFSETVVSFRCSQNSTLCEKPLTILQVGIEIFRQFTYRGRGTVDAVYISSSRRSEWTVNLVALKGGCRDVYQGA